MNYQTYLFFEGRTEYIQRYDTPQHTYPLGSLMFGVLDLDAEGSIVGGVILPSPALSLSALVRNTAQLPQIDMELPAKRFLGTNTTDCLHSGIVNGSALMLDGLFARCRATLHAPDAPVIATGTLPASIRDACATPIEYNGTLILDGLYSIWKRNVKK